MNNKETVMAIADENDQQYIEQILQTAAKLNLDIKGGKITRTSSRFCLGVEHGDYNGTELFGVGTDRFIWFAYKPNGTNENRLYSINFPDDGIIEFTSGDIPVPQSLSIKDSWSRFAFGVDYILTKQGRNLKNGIDGIVLGNIPGGGMSRSASITLNLIISMLDANGIKIDDQMKIVDLAQEVENDYIGSPCGKLDQIMILFAKENMGTHYKPQTRQIEYVKLGEKAEDLRIVVMDTGTIRPGLEKSTYKIRRAECDNFAQMLSTEFNIKNLADVKRQSIFDEIIKKYQQSHPDLCDRFRYIFNAQKRFYSMLDAFKKGDMNELGRIFRADGIELRDLYKISGAELESMCDIARTVDGVLGERMLGGGDKGAAGALVRADAVDKLKKVIQHAYPQSRPQYKDNYAVHTCKIVDGVKVIEV